MEVDHIVQVAGATYELRENYFATCRPCHEAKHQKNLRSQQIAVKAGKGEWLTAEQQLAVFGRTYD